jgi:threonine dehydratase
MWRGCRRLSAASAATGARVAMPQGMVMRTPLLESPALSALAGVDVLLKMECMQVSAAIPHRGPLSRLEPDPGLD